MAEDNAEIVWLIRSLVGNQGLKATWNIFGESFSPEFQAFINEQFRKAESENTSGT